MPLRTINLSFWLLDNTRFPVNFCQKSATITVLGEEVIVRFIIPNDISEELTIAELGRWDYKRSDMMAVGLSSAVVVRGSDVFFLRCLDYPRETILDDEFAQMSEATSVPYHLSDGHIETYDETTGRIVVYLWRTNKFVLFDPYWAY